MVARNLFNTSHKTTNKKYREGYERAFSKEKKGKADEDRSIKDKKK